MNALDPHGPAAGAIAQLGWFVLGLLSLVAVAVTALLVVAAVRKRGTLGEHAPASEGGGQRWIIAGGLIFPVVVLGLVFGLMLPVLKGFPLHEEGAHAPPDIRIVGRQWWWEITYLGDAPDDRVVTANELHIPIGWPVEIELESHDVIHSFWVPELHGKVDLIPGRKNYVRIQADQPGVYEGQCAEFCGAQHALMRLVVVAETLDDFTRWRKQQASPAVATRDDRSAAGKALFETKACGLCHTIRGTQALGSNGPDLTHLASRRGLAANSLPNSHAYLSAWVVRAQSLKPGAQMPDVDDFSGDELRALTHYLLQLE